MVEYSTLARKGDASPVKLGQDAQQQWSCSKPVNTRNGLYSLHEIIDLIVCSCLSDGCRFPRRECNFHCRAPRLEKASDVCLLQLLEGVVGKGITQWSLTVSRASACDNEAVRYVVIAMRKLLKLSHHYPPVIGIHYLI
jgi:hypothetical protein